MESTIDMTSILKTLESFEEKQNSTKQDMFTNEKPISKVEEDKPEEIELKPDATLTELLEQAIKNSKLTDSVFLKANEIVSYSSCYKKLSIEGRVSKKQENELN